MLGFLLGLAMLSLGSEIASRGIRELSLIFNLPESVLGTTLAALSTSLPELFIVLSVAFSRAEARVALDTIFASFVLQGTLAISVIAGKRKLRFSRKIGQEFKYVLYLTLVFALLASDGSISVVDGTVLLLLYAFFLSRFFSLQFGKKKALRGFEALVSGTEGLMAAMAGLILLLLGGEIAVRSALDLVEKSALSPFLLGVIAGLGTSIPDTTLSYRAVREKMNNLAMSNIAGSNLAMVGLALGVLGILHPFRVSPDFVIYMLSVALLDWYFLKDGDLRPLETAVFALSSLPLFNFLFR